MFRPVLAAVAAVVMVSLAGCADKPAAPAASSAPTRVEIPAPAGTQTDPVIRSSSAATCRSDCNRSYRVCGEGDSATPGMDRLQSLTNPRLFSRADDCRHSLEQCLNRCTKQP